MAVQINDVVDRNLFERYGDVQAFGYNKVALDPANWDNRGDRNPLVNAMNQYMSAYGIYKLMVLVSPDGKVLAVNSKDALGKPLATDALYLKSYRDASWLKAALSGDFLKGRNGFTGTVVEQPGRHPDLAQLYNGDDYALIFAASVADDSGKTIGVWVNFAGMALVEDIAAGAHKQFQAGGIDGVDVTLVNPSGIALVHYDNQKLDNTGNYVRDWSVLGKLSLAAFSADLAKVAAGSNAGAIEMVHAVKKLPHVAGFSRSYGAYDYSGLGWSAVVQLPADKVFADLNKVERVIGGVLLAALTLSIGVGLWFGGSLAKPIRRVTTALTDLRGGKVDIDTTGRERRDEIGEALTAATEIRDRIVRGLQTSGALDSITAAVTMADADNTVIYVNRSAQALFDAAVNDIRKELHQFDPKALVGTKIDIFQKNPELQPLMLADLKTPQRASVMVGGRRFDFTVVPVYDATGKRLGSAVEWRDVTQEHAVQVEIQNIVAAAVAGDFDRRLDPAGKTDFMLTLSEGMNNLLGTVSNALDEVKDVVGALAEGKLGARMSTEYSGVLAQLSTDINGMGARLSEIVGGITEGSETIASAASEISQATDDLAARTEQQAANLEETAAAMEEMTATVQKNADNAVQANELVEEARSRATTGGEIVDKAVSAVDSIQKSSGEMAEIVNLIDDIAFQTNLLALNAAVEAARAGDAGKGFAVVATEVRSLAQRSGEAAKNIKDLIKTSNNHVDAGVRLVNETGDALKGIIQSVSQIATIMQDVTSASREQATGLGEVNSAVSQMDEMTQQNAAMVEQTQAAAKSLADEAAHLSERVGFFDVSGARSTAAPSGKIAAPRPSKSA